MTLAQTAERHQLDLVIVFGSTARTGHGRDLDLALEPSDPLQGWQRPAELLREFSAALGRNDLDLVWLPDSSWLLGWQVARDGVVAYEARPGLFHRWKQAAYWRQRDSDQWRRRGEAYLERFLKGDYRVDRDLVREKRLAMAQYLSELEMVLSHSEEEFYKNPLLHRTAERDLELLVQCAGRINSEMAQALGVPPTDYASSFFALARGVLDAETAQELADCARMRNLLVHQYERVGLPQVYAAVRRSFPFWKRYFEKLQGQEGSTFS